MRVNSSCHETILTLFFLGKTLALGPPWLVGKGMGVFRNHAAEPWMWASFLFFLGSAAKYWPP